ncbi:MAG: methylenetetrahydrofolate reductase [Bifidobacteriaceae bacterium]|jgi:methylenetetrahydrofolate reductase (NADPH)|nr:methylenetetrahydrofolate reductase [Bifidobacteriaceae bacterium]
MANRVMAALAAAAPSLSFEFFPPKDAAGAATLRQRAGELAALEPDFVSVTYGAGGGRDHRAEASIEATRWLAEVLPAARVAHLALAGHSVAELRQAVERFTAAQVDGFMALRGDPPGGPGTPWVAAADGLTYAVELVELIRGLSDCPVGVAAFPYGHPTASSLAADAAVLAGKQAAGAQFAITQVLFAASAYEALVERAQRAGATLPLVPGVMPITGRSRISKLQAFSGAPLPGELSRRLELVQTPDELDEVGLDWSVQLVEELLAAGAPGVHFYTLNGSTATGRICQALGLKGALAA